jgi:hypothetical protein
MSALEKFCQELDLMAKSMGDAEADDKKIRDAAAAGNPDADNDGKRDVGGDGDGDENGGDGDGDGDEMMGKSFAFTLENGEVIEAMDGTALVKSLLDRVDTNEAQMVKAMEMAIGMIGRQGELIKSLQARVGQLAGEGRGRKAVLSVVEKPPVGSLQKSHQQSQGMSSQEFMAKALNLQTQGVLTGLDVARAESALNRGIPVPRDIVERVTAQ